MWYADITVYFFDSFCTVTKVLRSVLRLILPEYYVSSGIFTVFDDIESMK